MSEWLKEHAWKACVGETLPRVRIPLSPPTSFASLSQLRCSTSSGRATRLAARQRARVPSTTPFPSFVASNEQVEWLIVSRQKTSPIKRTGSIAQFPAVCAVPSNPAICRDFRPCFASSRVFSVVTATGGFGASKRVVSAANNCSSASHCCDFLPKVFGNPPLDEVLIPTILL